VENSIKANSLSFVQSLLNDQVISPQDLSSFATYEKNDFDPEGVREEMERWYRTLGVEDILQREFSLGHNPFTREELIEAQKQQEIVLCVPKGMTRQQLGLLFHLSSWAIADELVPDVIEVEDFWFKTKQSLLPEGLNKTGTEVQRQLEKEGKLGMSLNRYMVFVARIRYIMRKTPDVGHWVWLTRGRYDQKGMLVAGFDANHKFSVHGWLPHFQGKLCGTRYVSHPDHL